MLNELRELNLARDKFRSAANEPDFQHYKESKRSSKQSPTFIVCLGDSGVIEDVAVGNITKDNMVYKWVRNNSEGNSFPVFNVPSLYVVEDQDDKKSLEKIKKSLKEAHFAVEQFRKLIGRAQMPWQNNQQIENCIKDIPKDLKEILGAVGQESRCYSIVELCNRSMQFSKESFSTELERVILRKVNNNDGEAAELMNLLISPKRESQTKLQLILELSDHALQSLGENILPATHREVQKLINSKLWERYRAKTEPLDMRKDAFGGCFAGELGRKYPGVKIDALGGEVKLRSMNHESECQYRYGMINEAGFPAGQDMRTIMADDLKWLSGSPLKGKTWKDITVCVGGGFTGIFDKKKGAKFKREKGVRRTVLFAYPSALSETPPDIAEFFGSINDNDFQAEAKKVIGSLSAIVQEYPNSEVRIFVLQKLNKGQTRLMLSNRFSTARLLQAAEAWQEGYQLFQDTRKPYLDNDIDDKWNAPSPMDILWCLNTVWKRGGTYATSVPNFEMQYIFELLIGEGYLAKDIVVRALNIYLRNITPLVSSLGLPHINDLIKEKKFDVPKELQKQAYLIPSVLSLLLYKKEKLDKGGIMESTAFLIGRILSLVDQLHVNYCIVIRNKSISSQLIGNSLLGLALNNPEKALSFLSERIKNYKTWPTTYKNTSADDDVIKAISISKNYILPEMGKISAILSKETLPTKCTDADRAKMLLGYLAKNESLTTN